MLDRLNKILLECVELDLVITKPEEFRFVIYHQNSVNVGRMSYKYRTSSGYSNYIRMVQAGSLDMLFSGMYFNEPEREFLFRSFYPDGSYGGVNKYHDICRWDAQNKLVWKFSLPNHYLGQELVACVIYTFENLLVLDRKAHRVHVIDSKQQTLRHFETLKFPSGIVATPDDLIVVWGEEETRVSSSPTFEYMYALDRQV
jgi:hypothetical protein